MESRVMSNMAVAYTESSPRWLAAEAAAMIESHTFDSNFRKSMRFLKRQAHKADRREGKRACKLGIAEHMEYMIEFSYDPISDDENAAMQDALDGIWAAPFLLNGEKVQDNPDPWESFEDYLDDDSYADFYDDHVAHYDDDVLYWPSLREPLDRLDVLAPDPDFG